jgi:hypothetical protein
LIYQITNFVEKGMQKQTECLTSAHPREAGKNFATSAASPAGAQARTKKFRLKIHFYPCRLTTQETYTPVLASNFAWAAGYTYQNRDTICRSRHKPPPIQTLAASVVHSRSSLPRIRPPPTAVAGDQPPPVAMSLKRKGPAKGAPSRLKPGGDYFLVPLFSFHCLSNPLLPVRSCCCSLLVVVAFLLLVAYETKAFLLLQMATLLHMKS